MGVVKEDRKVCNMLKWRQLIGCGRPKDQETVVVVFYGSTSVSEHSLSKKYIMFFFPPTKSCLTEEKKKNLKITQT